MYQEPAEHKVMTDTLYKELRAAIRRVSTAEAEARRAFPNDAKAAAKLIAEINSEAKAAENELFAWVDRKLQTRRQVIFLGNLAAKFDHNDVVQDAIVRILKTARECEPEALEDYLK